MPLMFSTLLNLKIREQEKGVAHEPVAWLTWEFLSALLEFFVGVP